MYTLGRALAHVRTLLSNTSSNWSEEQAKLCVEDSLVEFWSRGWPFHFGEGVLTTVGPYNTGTLQVVNGDATITLTGGTFLFASWPVPAVLRCSAGRGEEFLITSFTDGTHAELDVEWPYDSESGVTYTIEFPAYDLDPNLDIKDVMSAYSFKRMVDASSYREIMAFRHGWLYSGYPAWYTVVPGDGTISDKIWLSPSPNTPYTLRYTYTRKVPPFFIYGSGSATFTAANPTVTGSVGTGLLGTHWLTCGYTLTGNVIEVVDIGNPQAASGVIQAVGGESTLTLTGNWPGRAAAAVKYTISPKIVMPDDCISAFRALCEAYAYARFEPDRAELARGMAMQAMEDAKRRNNRNAETRYWTGVNGGIPMDPNSGPGFPTELVVTTT